MRITRVLSKVSIVILCFGLIAGTLWVLDFFAVINVYKTAQMIPVVGKKLPQRNDDKIKKAIKIEKNPLEDENKKLLAEIDKLKKQTGELDKKLQVANQEKQSLLDARNNLQAAIDSLEASQDQQAAAKLSYEKLAKYYAEMKAEAAVKIMDNLSDEVTIGILQNLADDQVAKILSAMDPGKAAAIIDKMKQ